MSLDIDYTHGYLDIEIVGVLPGGDYFITLDDTRAEVVTLSLRSIHSLGVSQKITDISTSHDALELLAVHCVSASVFRLVTFALKEDLSKGNLPELRIIECDTKGSIRTVTHEQVPWKIRASHLDDDIWVVMWETQEGEAFVRIRDLHSHEEVVVNLIRPLLGRDFFSMSAHKGYLILATGYNSWIYHLPMLTSRSEMKLTGPLPPIWTAPAGDFFTNVLVCEQASTDQSAVFAIWTGSNIRIFRESQDGGSTLDVIKQKVDGPSSLALRPGIHPAFHPSIVFSSIRRNVKPDEDAYRLYRVAPNVPDLPGLLRLDRDPSRSGMVVSDELDSSWCPPGIFVGENHLDEESGRCILLFGSRGERPLEVLPPYYLAVLSLVP